MTLGGGPEAYADSSSGGTLGLRTRRSRFTMKKRHWEERQGRVPGPGTSYARDSYRPETAGLVTKSELAERLGISNRAVVGSLILRLKVEPAQTGWTRIATYRNGGKGGGSFDVDYYPEALVEQLREELRAHSTDLGDGRFRYHDKTYRWLPEPG
jgi:hypothetical protein